MNKLIILSVFMGLLVGCKKDEAEVLTEELKDQKIAADNSLAENASDDVSTMADEAYNNGKLVTRDGSGGNTILGDTVRITRGADSTITIDFGSTGITCRDGKIRRGQIIIRFSNGFRRLSSTVTQSFNNYSINGNAFSNTSTRSVTYKGLDAFGNPYWEITANITITKADGKIITWTRTGTRTMTAGYNTPLNWTDDEYKIEGSSSGTSTSIGSTSNTFSTVITKPLFIKVGCQYILDGKITHTRNTRTISIDYGYGGMNSCDAQALVTLPNGNTVIITM